MAYWTVFKSYLIESVLNQAFYFLDKDGNKSLSVDELKGLVETINSYYETGLNPSEEDMSHLIALIDKDKNGRLSLQEIKDLFNKA